jgi:predicted acylesterase/phospholipase RssA/CRP-like cAMP-binding protein
LTSVFGRVEDTLFEKLSSEMEIIDVAGGTALFHQEDPADSLYILLRGRLNVSVTDPETGVEKLLGETSPGESIGEIGLLTGEPRSASLWATRDSRLARIRKDAFDTLAESHPDLVRGLARVVVELLRKRTSSSRYSPRVSNIAIVPARANNGAAQFARQLQGVLQGLGATLLVDSEQIASFADASQDKTTAPDTSDDSRFGGWLARAEDENRFLLLQADAELTDWTRRCIRQADVVLTVGLSTDDPQPSATEQELIDRASSVQRVRQILVLLHPESTSTIQGTARWLDARSVDEHHHVRVDVPGDVDRLARIISGTAIGLVLGGGGARGFAHAGVYRALVEHGIPIDWVGGTSIGAVFSAGIAFGWDPQRVEDEARRSFVNEKPFGDYTLPLVALLRGKRIDRLAQSSFPGNIEDMLIPYFCVSSDLTSSSLTIHERGDLWRAIRASVSLPGVLPPAVWGKHLAIDGGILNNLPIDIMRTRSVGTIIAVDLSVEKDYELDYPEMPGAMQILISRLPFAQRLRVPGIVTLMMKATVMASGIHAKTVRGDATLLLRPPVGRFGLLATNDFDEIVEVGYRHACEELKSWSPATSIAPSPS